MRHRSILSIIAGLSLLIFSTTIYAQPGSTTDVPRTISYQGLLTSADGGTLGDGTHDITVTLYADEAGTQVVWRDSYEALTANGVFNLYLGSKAPLPSPLEMNRPLWVGTSINGAEEMRPLTPLTSSPYALNLPDQAVTTEKLADGAVTADKVGMDYVAGFRVNGEEIAGKGAVLNLVGTPAIPVAYDAETRSLTIGRSSNQTSDNEKGAGILAGGPVVWSVNGDIYDVSTSTPGTPTTGDWFGTSNSVAVTIKANGSRVMQYVPQTNSPLVIGGHQSNSVSGGSDGSIIAAGGNSTNPNQITSVGGYNVISGGEKNLIDGSNHSTIGGGFNNSTDALYTTTGGGKDNTIGSNYATIAGGVENSASDVYTFIGGGYSNDASSGHAVVAGGENNTASGAHSFIGGGRDNQATSIYSTANGGYQNRALDIYSTVGGGHDNESSGFYSTVAGGQVNEATDNFSTVSGGGNNRATAIGAAIGGGSDNQASSDYATTSGGEANNASGAHSAIGGGKLNTASGTYTTIGGGQYNNVLGTFTTIGGGNGNIVAGTANTTGGGESNQIALETEYNTIGGGKDNEIESAGNATIAGGRENIVASSANTATIGGGYQNQITSGGVLATIPGGNKLIAQSYAQSVLGVSNVPKGSIAPGFTVARTDTYNPPMFIIGNGNDLAQSNAFEVSYNGHSVVYDRNGTGASRAAIRGATYMDNTIYSWGYITPQAGTQRLQVNCDFGVDQSTATTSPRSGYQGVGRYIVVLNLQNPDGTQMQLECGSSVTATVAASGPECVYITASPIRWDAVLGRNVFDVFITKQRITTIPPSQFPTLVCEGEDKSFMFKVTGRPVL